MHAPGYSQNLYKFVEPIKTKVYKHQTCKGRNINDFSATGQYVCIESHHDNSPVLFLKDMKRQVMSEHSCPANFVGILCRIFYTHPPVRTATLSQSSESNTRLCLPVLSPGFILLSCRLDQQKCSDYIKQTQPKFQSICKYFIFIVKG